MLFSGLSNKEKIWSSNSAVFLSADDNFVFDKEIEYPARYRNVLALEAPDDSIGFEKALDLFAKNSNDKAKRSVFLELCCMSLCDSHFLPVENRNLSCIAETPGIEKYEYFTACAKDIAALRNSIFKLTGESSE